MKKEAVLKSCFKSVLSIIEVEQAAATQKGSDEFLSQVVVVSSALVVAADVVKEAGCKEISTRLLTFTVEYAVLVGLSRSTGKNLVTSHTNYLKRFLERMLSNGFDLDASV